MILRLQPGSSFTRTPLRIIPGSIWPSCTGAGAGTATAEIRNNIFFGSSPMTHLYSGPTLTGAVIDNNCYREYPEDPLFHLMIGYGVSTYTTVAEWNGTGFESHGIGSGDLGLADPGNDDFTLLSSSVCTTLGNPAVGVPVDYSGYPFSTPPSSGAYQYRGF